jgi:glycolate oxidase FAD binding subunit
LSEIEATLGGHGQYLPFDPPFVARGATLGGTVAAGVSGPGRYRYGGVRDFLLGAHFVDGEGQVVRGGGRVVKNAAGFGLQHLLLGSLGRAGILLDLTFKVFPKPRAHVTLLADYPALAAAVDQMVTLRRSAFEMEALDLIPPGTLLVRLGGDASALESRTGTVTEALGVPVRVEQGASEQERWSEARELGWVRESAAIVKVPLTPRSLPALDDYLESRGAIRRYSVGGEVAWIGWPGPLMELDRALSERMLSGLVLVGAADDPLLGQRPNATFLQRTQQALDPRGVFTGTASKV